jgi:hypothetical protein
MGETTLQALDALGLELVSFLMLFLTFDAAKEKTIKEKEQRKIITV